MWNINFYIICETNPMVFKNHLWTSSLESGKTSMDQEGFLKIMWSTSVNFLATEKCDISLLMYIARQIQWCGQNYLVSERSWSFWICLIESTLWLTNRELVSVRNRGQLGIIQSTYDPRMAHLDFCQPWGTFIKPWAIWWLMQDSGTNSKVRKSSWRISRSTLIKIWTTEKCDILISMYFLRKKSNGVIKITYGHHPWN